MKYTNPVSELEKFVEADVITTSGDKPIVGEPDWD